jgi:hypothetical protein
MFPFAVKNAGFRDSRFHVIDSVWEPESFVGLRNFSFGRYLNKEGEIIIGLASIDWKDWPLFRIT